MMMREEGAFMGKAVKRWHVLLRHRVGAESIADDQHHVMSLRFGLCAAYQTRWRKHWKKNEKRQEPLDRHKCYRTTRLPFRQPDAACVHRSFMMNGPAVEGM